MLSSVVIWVCIFLLSGLFWVFSFWVWKFSLWNWNGIIPIFIFIFFYFFHKPIFKWHLLPTHFVFFSLLLSFKLHLTYFPLYTYSKTLLFFTFAPSYNIQLNSISDFRYSMISFILFFRLRSFIILLIRINLIGNHLCDFFRFPPRIEEIFVKKFIFHLQLLTSLVFSSPHISEAAVEPFHCTSTFFLHQFHFFLFIQHFHYKWKTLRRECFHIYSFRYPYIQLHSTSLSLVFHLRSFLHNLPHSFLSTSPFPDYPLSSWVQPTEQQTSTNQPHQLSNPLQKPVYPLPLKSIKRNRSLTMKDLRRKVVRW